MTTTFRYFIQERKSPTLNSEQRDEKKNLSKRKDKNMRPSDVIVLNYLPEFHGPLTVLMSLIVLYYRLLNQLCSIRLQIKDS